LNENGDFATLQTYAYGMAVEVKDGMKTYKKPIKASKLIEKLNEGGIEAEVENAEDCEAELMHVTISGDSGDECSVTAYYYYPEDQPNRGVSLGQIVFEVEGVRFEAERTGEGEHDTFELSGREIEYDDDLTEEDVIEAAEDNVEMPEYEPDSYEFDPNDFSDQDLKDAIEDEPNVYAEKDGVVYGFDSEDEIPEDEGFEQIDAEDAHEILISKRQNFEFEQWG